jgi:uncharacterized protein
MAAMDVVSRMYDCFNKADLETIRNEIFAQDIVWRLPGRHPLAGEKHGAEEVLAFFHQLNKAGVAVTLENIAEWTDDIVVEVHRGRADLGYAKFDGLNCTHYHVRDGKITEVQVYTSDQYMLDDFFNKVYKYKPIPDRLAED